MKDLASANDPALGRLQGLLFDLDDTLLDHGRLLPQALGALYRLYDAGLELYAVTGRPASWGAILTHQWPIEGAVTENGAIAFERRNDRVVPVEWVTPSERQRRSEALRGIVRELRERHPELEPADDVSGRVSDYTFDIGEHRRVEPSQVARVRHDARALGAMTTASSVHLHVTLDRADKASGIVRLIQSRRGMDPFQVLSSYAFIGDSENDASCFAAFRASIGVGNLSGRPTLPPRFRVAEERAAGFVRAAELLLACRRDLG